MSFFDIKDLPHFSKEAIVKSIGHQICGECFRWSALPVSVHPLTMSWRCNMCLKKIDNAVIGQDVCYYDSQDDNALGEWNYKN